MSEASRLSIYLFSFWSRNCLILLSCIRSGDYDAHTCPFFTTAFVRFSQLSTILTDPFSSVNFMALDIKFIKIYSNRFSSQYRFSKNLASNGLMTKAVLIFFLLAMNSRVLMLWLMVPMILVNWRKNWKV